MSRPKQICAVIDVQGFFVQKKFYPREISIVNNEHKICFEIVPDINVDTKLDYFKYFKFQQHQLHGIPLEKVLDDKTKKVFHASQMKKIVEEIYFRVRTEERKLFGVKNQQVANLLKEFEIPYFNFESEEVGGEICPPLSIFDKFKSSKYCLLHATLKCKFNENIHRCALRKALLIWDWLNCKVDSDLLVDEIFPQKSVRDLKISA